MMVQYFDFLELVLWGIMNVAPLLPTAAWSGASQKRCVFLRCVFVCLLMVFFLFIKNISEILQGGGLRTFSGRVTSVCVWCDVNLVRLCACCP